MHPTSGWSRQVSTLAAQPTVRPTNMRKKIFIALLILINICTFIQSMTHATNIFNTNVKWNSTRWYEVKKYYGSELEDQSWAIMKVSNSRKYIERYNNMNSISNYNSAFLNNYELIFDEGFCNAIIFNDKFISMNDFMVKGKISDIAYEYYDFFPNRKTNINSSLDIETTQTKRCLILEDWKIIAPIVINIKMNYKTGEKQYIYATNNEMIYSNLLINIKNISNINITNILMEICSNKIYIRK